MALLSSAEVVAVFGKINGENRAGIRDGLHNIEKTLRGPANDLSCNIQVDCGLAGSFWVGLEFTLSSRRTIDNEDGTVSYGSLDLVVKIERYAEKGYGWLTSAWVTQNCNRRRCPDDPHTLFEEENTAELPEDAVDQAVTLTSRLVEWFESHPTDWIGYHTHR